MKLPYAVLASAGLAAGVLGGCTAGESESPCTGTTSCAAVSPKPSDGTSPELSAAGRVSMLEDILNEAEFGKDVSSRSWNGTVIQVGVWTDTTTQDDRLSLCDAIVTAIRPTGLVDRVTVSAFQTSPSAGLQAATSAAANPLVIWLSPEANCKVDG
ncbi:hypothetical protein KRM28CT15_14870 [Krasilnikovia sp. M28-CT-15]